MTQEQKERLLRVLDDTATELTTDRRLVEMRKEQTEKDLVKEEAKIGSLLADHLIGRLTDCVDNIRALHKEIAETSLSSWPPASE